MEVGGRSLPSFEPVLGRHLQWAPRFSFLIAKFHFLHCSLGLRQDPDFFFPVVYNLLFVFTVSLWDGASDRITEQTGSLPATAYESVVTYCYIYVQLRRNEHVRRHRNHCLRLLQLFKPHIPKPGGGKENRIQTFLLAIGLGLRLVVVMANGGWDLSPGRQWAIVETLQSSGKCQSGHILVPTEYFLH